MWQWLWGADSEEEIPTTKSITKTSTILTIPSKHGDTPCVEEECTHTTPVVTRPTITKSQRLFLLISLVVAGVGYVFAVAGAVTNHWRGTGFSGHGHGLFTCYKLGCATFLIIVQVAIVIGFLAASAATAMIGCYIAFKDKMPPWMLTAGGVVYLVGGIVTLTGIIVYAALIKDDLQWSFFLAAWGGFLFQVAGGLVMAKGRG